MQKVFSRMGDGWATELSEAELMKDIVDGSARAAGDAGIDPLTTEEIDHIFDICKNVIKKRSRAGACSIFDQLVQTMGLCKVE